MPREKCCCSRSPARPRTTTSIIATSPSSCACGSPRRGWAWRSSPASSTASLSSDPPTASWCAFRTNCWARKGMTEHRSTFSRRDAIQHWARVHQQGESAERIVRLTDGWLSQREIVPLEPDSGSPRRSRRPAAADAARPPRRAHPQIGRCVLGLGRGGRRRLSRWRSNRSRGGRRLRRDCPSRGAVTPASLSAPAAPRRAGAGRGRWR